MKKSILIFACLLALTSCQRGCEQTRRSWQTTERNYTIVMFSGGDTVFVDRFSGIVNNSEDSDGIYYYKNDTLVEVSGDYIMHSQ